MRPDAWMSIAPEDPKSVSPCQFVESGPLVNRRRHPALSVSRMWIAAWCEGRRDAECEKHDALLGNLSQRLFRPSACFDCSCANIVPHRFSAVYPPFGVAH